MDGLSRDSLVAPGKSVDSLVAPTITTSPPADTVDAELARIESAQAELEDPFIGSQFPPLNPSVSFVAGVRVVSSPTNVSGVSGGGDVTSGEDVEKSERIRSASPNWRSLVLERRARQSGNDAQATEGKGGTNNGAADAVGSGEQEHEQERRERLAIRIQGRWSAVGGRRVVNSRLQKNLNGTSPPPTSPSLSPRPLLRPC